MADNKLFKIIFKAKDELSPTLERASKKFSEFVNGIKRAKGSIQGEGDALNNLKSFTESYNQTTANMSKVLSEVSNAVTTLTSRLQILEVAQEDHLRLERASASALEQYLKVVKRQMDMQFKGTQQREKLASGLLMVKSHAMALGTVFTMLGTGMTLAMKKATDGAAEFEHVMQMVKAITRSTTAQFKAMKAEALDLGRRTIFTAEQAAEGLRYLAMAGMKTATALRVLPVALRLAEAGMMDLGQSADIMTNIMAGFNLTAKDAEHVGDALSTVFTNTNSTLTDLGTAMSYVGATAKSVGADFDEVISAVGLLHNAGIKGARAGTSLQQALMRLFNPSKKMTITMDRLAKNIGQTSFRITDAEGKFIGFANLIDELNKAGATGADIMAMFGARAGPAMSAMVVQGSAALRNLTARVKLLNGSLREATKTMDKGIWPAMKRFTSATTGLSFALVLPASHAISGILDWISKFINGMTDLLKKRTSFASFVFFLISSITAITAAAGSLLVLFALFGKSIGEVSTWLWEVVKTSKLIGPLWKGLISLGPKLAGVFALLTSSTLGWVAIIGAAVAAGAGLYLWWKKHNEELQKSIEFNKKLADSERERYNDLVKIKEVLVSTTATEAEKKDAARALANALANVITTYDDEYGVIADINKARKENIRLLDEEIKKTAERSRISLARAGAEEARQLTEIRRKLKEASEERNNYLKYGVIHPGAGGFRQQLDMLFGKPEDIIKREQELIQKARGVKANVKADAEDLARAYIREGKSFLQMRMAMASMLTGPQGLSKSDQQFIELTSAAYKRLTETATKNVARWDVAIRTLRYTYEDEFKKMGDALTSLKARYKNGTISLEQFINSSIGMLKTYRSAYEKTSEDITKYVNQVSEAQDEKKRKELMARLQPAVTEAQKILYATQSGLKGLMSVYNQSIHELERNIRALDSAVARIDGTYKSAMRSANNLRLSSLNYTDSERQMAKYARAVQDAEEAWRQLQEESQKATPNMDVMSRLFNSIVSATGMMGTVEGKWGGLVVNEAQAAQKREYYLTKARDLIDKTANKQKRADQIRLENIKKQNTLINAQLSVVSKLLSAMAVLMETPANAFGPEAKARFDELIKQVNTQVDSINKELSKPVKKVVRITYTTGKEAPKAKPPVPEAKPKTPQSGGGPTEDTFWGGFMHGMSQKLDSYKTFSKSVTDLTTKTTMQFASGWADAFSAFVTGTKSAREAFHDFYKNILIWTAQMTVKLLIMTALTTLLGLGSGGKVGGKTAKGKQTGGRVYGEPGPDKVPIMATAGEWVIRASAVRFYGDALMEAINSMRFPRISGSSAYRALGAEGHYQHGGPVTASSGLSGGGDIVIANVLSSDDIYRVMADTHKGATVVLNHIGAALDTNHPVIRRLRQTK